MITSSLDKEDIEDLGWYKFDSHCYCILNNKRKGLCWYLYMTPGRLSINQGIVGELTFESFQIFRGVVENKTDLIKLMKQLLIK